MITGNELKQIIPSLSTERADILARIIRELGPAYGISRKTMPAFLANVAVESAEFRTKLENLNYSAQGLIKTFSYYANNPALAALHGRTERHPARPELIANTIYADKNRPPKRKLGNVNSGDGWLFIGAGFGQLTGRNLFTSYARYKKASLDTVVDMLRSSDRWAMDSAMWLFAIEKKLLDEAERGDIKTVSIRWAGSEMHLKERTAYYNKAKEVLSKPMPGINPITQQDPNTPVPIGKPTGPTNIK